MAGETKHMGPRSLVFEGSLAKTKSGRKLHGYLFNDLLLLVEPKAKADAKGYQYLLYRKVCIPVGSTLRLPMHVADTEYY